MIPRTTALFTLLFVCLAVQAQPLTMRTVELTASIRDPADLPVADVAIAIRNDIEVNRKASHMYFDASGNAATTVEVPVDASYLTLVLVPAIQSPISDPENKNIMNRFRHLSASVSFRPRYRVPLLADQTSYSIAVQGLPVVTITGRLVTPEGTPLPGSVWARGSWGSTSLRAPTDGHFSLNGVALGRPTDLCILSDAGFSVHVQPLSAEQTGANLDVGDVVMQPIEAQCFVRVHLEPRQGDSLTLINSVSGQVLRFRLNNEGEIAATPNGPPGVSVPEGDYVVAAGSLMMDEGVLELYDLVRVARTGAHPELSLVAARPNQPAVITIDPKVTLRKIKAAAAAEGITPNP